MPLYRKQLITAPRMRGLERERDRLNGEIGVTRNDIERLEQLMEETSQSVHPPSRRAEQQCKLALSKSELQWHTPSRGRLAISECDQKKPRQSDFHRTERDCLEPVARVPEPPTQERDHGARDARVRGQ